MGTHRSGDRGGLPPPAPAPRVLTEAASSLASHCVSHGCGKSCGSSIFVWFTSLPVWWPLGQPAWRRTWELPFHQGGFPREKVSAQTSPPPTAGREGGTEEGVSNAGTVASLSQGGWGRVKSHRLPAMAHGATESGFMAN